MGFLWEGSDGSEGSTRAEGPGLAGLETRVSRLGRWQAGRQAAQRSGDGTEHCTWAGDWGLGLAGEGGE